MSKFGTFSEYPKDSLASAEKALLTAWRSLERYHDDLVLLGGLAVHYLTKPNLKHRDARSFESRLAMANLRVASGALSERTFWTWPTRTRMSLSATNPR